MGRMGQQSMVIAVLNPKTQRTGFYRVFQWSFKGNNFATALTVPGNHGEGSFPSRDNL